MFFAFRIMLGIGFFMIAAALFGALLWWRGRLFDTRWYPAHRGAYLVGRLRRRHRRLGGHRKRPAAMARPWHPAHRRRGLAGAGSQVAVTLALFVVVYGIVFSIGIYYINRLIAGGRSRRDVEAADAAAQSAGRRADAGRKPRGRQGG